MQAQLAGSTSSSSQRIRILHRWRRWRRALETARRRLRPLVSSHSPGRPAWRKPSKFCHTQRPRLPFQSGTGGSARPGAGASVPVRYHSATAAAAPRPVLQTRGLVPCRRCHCHCHWHCKGRRKRAAWTPPPLPRQPPRVDVRPRAQLERLERERRGAAVGAPRLSPAADERRRGARAGRRPVRAVRQARGAGAGAAGHRSVSSCVQDNATCKDLLTKNSARVACVAIPRKSGLFPDSGARVPTFRALPTAGAPGRACHAHSSNTRLPRPPSTPLRPVPLCYTALRDSSPAWCSAPAPQHARRRRHGEGSDEQLGTLHNDGWRSGEQVQQG